MAPSNPQIKQFIIDGRAAGLNDTNIREQLVAAGWDQASIDGSFNAQAETSTTPPPPPPPSPESPEPASASTQPQQVAASQPTMVAPDGVASSASPQTPPTNPLTTPTVTAASTVLPAAASAVPQVGGQSATASAPARSRMIKKITVLVGAVAGLVLVGLLLFFFVFSSDSPEAVFRKMIENNLNSSSYTRSASSDGNGSSFDITADFNFEDDESRASFSEFNSATETSVGKVTFSLEHIAVQDEDYVRVTDLAIDFSDPSLQGSLSEDELFALWGLPDKDTWSEYSPGMAGGFFDDVVTLNGIAGTMPVGPYQKDSVLADMIFAAYDIDFESAEIVERDGRELLELSFDGDTGRIEEFNDYIFDSPDFGLDDSDQTQSTFESNDGTLWVDVKTKRLARLDIETDSTSTLTVEYSNYEEVDDIERPL